jgi:hypothetical protein
MLGYNKIKLVAWFDFIVAFLWSILIKYTTGTNHLNFVRVCVCFVKMTNVRKNETQKQAK